MNIDDSTFIKEGRAVIDSKKRVCLGKAVDSFIKETKTVRIYGNKFGIFLMPVIDIPLIRKYRKVK